MSTNSFDCQKTGDHLNFSDSHPNYSSDLIMSCYLIFLVVSL